MSEPMPPCPNCQSQYVYPDPPVLICPECAHEWDPNALDEDIITAKDANGAVLNAGDKATVIKDLKIKGSSQVIKIGSKVLIRRIQDSKDHELDCKVEGAGEMMVTAKFVKKS